MNYSPFSVCPVGSPQKVDTIPITPGIFCTPWV